MKSITTVVVTVALAVCFLGCSNEDSTITRPRYSCEAGDTIRVDPGSTYIISKEAGISAGCMWEFERGFDEHYVELLEYTVTNTNPGMEGAPFIQEWKYWARDLGTICCTMEYRCVWEDEPLQTQHIVVIIE